MKVNCCLVVQHKQEDLDAFSVCAIYNWKRALCGSYSTGNRNWVVYRIETSGAFVNLFVV